MIAKPSDPDFEIQPILKLTLRPPDSPPIALGFKLPAIPGIPDSESVLAAGLRSCARAPAFSSLSPREAEVASASLAEAFCRAKYHKLRFDDCLRHVRARRQALGGPSVADWQAVVPLVNEAIAVLGATRTAVDVLVYIAARRAGKSESGADAWDASDAIAPKSKPGDMPPSRYDVPEILAMRARQPWFDELNIYRNVSYHRGMGGDTYGFYEKADTVVEASNPEYNAMLLPDLAGLRDRKRPHEWTYFDKRRLDDLVESTDSGLNDLLMHILTNVWNCALPAPGTVPRSEQPNTMLFLPIPVSLEAPGQRIIPVFDTPRAAREFTLYGAIRDQLVMRAVRPTRIGAGKPDFLLPFGIDETTDAKGHQVHLYSMVDGKLTLIAAVPFEPTGAGPVPGIVSVRPLNENIQILYVWQSPPDRG